MAVASRSKGNIFLRNMLKYVFDFIFPINKEFNLINCACSYLVFQDDKIKIFLEKNLFTLGTYFMYIFIQLDGPFITQLRLLRSPFFGKIGKTLARGAVFVIAEIIVIKILMFNLTRKYKLAEKIPFIQLIKELDPIEEKKIFKFTKLIIISSAASIYSAYVLMITIESINAIDLEHVLSIVIWAGIFIHFARTGIDYVPILYSITIGGFQIVSNQMDQLSITLQDGNCGQFILSYLNYIRKVEKLNSITKMLLFVNNLLTIPSASAILFMFTLPADGLILTFYKMSIISCGTIYLTRGYLVTAYFSQINYKCKRIHSDINSSIARGKVNNLFHRKLLLLIAEDIASPKSHTAVREYNSTVTLMDTFNTIFASVSFVMLLFSLGSNLI